MKFVYHKMNYVSVIRRQPLPGQVENRYLHASHQHDVQHGIVRNENVRRIVLHIPSRPHLSAVDAWEKARCGRSGYLLRFLLHAAKFFAEPPRPCRIPCSRDWRPAGVSAEVKAVAGPTHLEPVTRIGTVERSSHAPKLIFHKGIQRVKNDRAHRRGTCGSVLVDSLRNARQALTGGRTCLMIPPIPLRVEITWMSPRC